jgi:hypothetical protein
MTLRPSPRLAALVALLAALLGLGAWHAPLVAVALAADGVLLALWLLDVALGGRLGLLQPDVRAFALVFAVDAARLGPRAVGLARAAARSLGACLVDERELRALAPQKLVLFTDAQAQGVPPGAPGAILVRVPPDAELPGILATLARALGTQA